MEDINYDEVFCEEGLTIILHKKKYEVKTPTLLQIFAFEKMVTDLNKMDNINKIVIQIKKIVRTVFNTIPNEALDKCSPTVLRRMIVDVRTLIQQTLFPGISEKEITDKKK
jgi:hypothetical protein